MAYNPRDWYWSGTPDGRQTTVYGTSRGAVVAAPTTDAAYLAWRSVNPPWPWPRDETGAVTAAALDAVLVSYGLAPTGLAAVSKSALIAHANTKIGALRSIARTYALGGGVSVSCDSQTATGTDLISIMTWGAANPTATTQWVDDAGVVTTITGAQAVTLANAVLVYGQSLYAVLAGACSGVASGSITTAAEIDALAWPV